MTKKRMDYEVPTSELLVVRFEGNFCATGTPGGAGGNDSYNDDDDLS